MPRNTAAAAIKEVAAASETNAPVPTGRFTVDQITAFAELDGATFDSVSIALDEEEIKAVLTARNVLASARVMDELESEFVSGFDKELAAAFVANLDKFANDYARLFKSAVVKDGRGGGTKNLRRVGEVRYNDKGDARVAAIKFATSHGSLRVILQSETTDGVTSVEK